MNQVCLNNTTVFIDICIFIFPIHDISVSFYHCSPIWNCSRVLKDSDIPRDIRHLIVWKDSSYWLTYIFFVLSDYYTWRMAHKDINNPTMRHILMTAMREQGVYKVVPSMFLIHSGSLAKILNLLFLVIYLSPPTQFGEIKRLISHQVLWCYSCKYATPALLLECA